MRELQCVQTARRLCARRLLRVKGTPTGTLSRTSRLHAGTRCVVCAARSLDGSSPARYEWRHMPHPHPTRPPASRSLSARLTRLDRSIASLATDLSAFKASLEPVVPHLAAIESLLHDLMMSLGHPRKTRRQVRRHR